MKSLLLIFLYLGFSLPAQAQTATVEAFSSWKARGQIYTTGVDEATFVGTFSGILYVKDSDKVLDIENMDAGLITCPVTMTINTKTNYQLGVGKCIIITPDKERIYAIFACQGKRLNGCNGEFKLTGGTGEKENITGGGPVQLKSTLSKLAASPGSIIEQNSVGLAVWPSLTYKISKP